MTMDTLSIYLINQSLSLQTFSCFWACPRELEQYDTYARTAACLAVRPNDQAKNRFVIPIDYFGGAGASREEVKANATIVNTIEKRVDPDRRTRVEMWYADYPPPQNPAMTETHKPAPKQSVELVASSFDKISNEKRGWFSSMSIGVHASLGFSGVTWSPTPDQSYAMVLRPRFVVGVGPTFICNTLISWKNVFENGGVLSETSFFRNAATVIYTSRGKWEVAPGPPLTV